MAFDVGSVAFVAYSFDNHTSAANQQGFAFVALAPIAASDQIRFVDGAMANNGTLTVDSQVVWTNSTGAAISAGSIIEVTFTTYNGSTGFTAAAVTAGTVAGPTASNGAAAAVWNIDTSDSLYAVTSLSGAAATTTVAAVVWGATQTNGITSGASVLNPAGNAATATDTAVINAATANASHADAAAARAAYTNPANWITDDDSSDGAAGAADADWPALSDLNSPLNGKAVLTVASPTFSFGDASGLVNASEAAGTPVTVSGLGTGASAVVTFKSSAGATTVTATFTANGATNVNLSGLGDGAVSIANAAVTNSGATTNYAGPPTSNSVTLDKTAPGSPAVADVADDVGGVTGPVAAGASTDDATPAVTVSLAGTNALAGDTVALLANGAQVGVATLTAADIGAGSVSIASSALGGDGTKSLTATLTDAAGNVSTASAARSVVLDTAAPATPSIAGVTDDQAPATGPVAGGGATNDATPTLSGTAEANSTVAVFDGATRHGRGRRQRRLELHARRGAGAGQSQLHRPHGRRGRQPERRLGRLRLGGGHNRAHGRAGDHRRDGRCWRRDRPGRRGRQHRRRDAHGGAVPVGDRGGRGRHGRAVRQRRSGGQQGADGRY